MANSQEEEVARDFMCFGKPDVTVVVTDATCLERNLNLVLQTLDITKEVVLCVNLIDEAKRKQININLKELSNLLGIPVIATDARSNQGLEGLIFWITIVGANYPSDAIAKVLSILRFQL